MKTVPGAARVGGAALILAALLFVAVFGMLASSFGYPDVLDGAAADVLPRLLALGESGRAVWALYAVIPLLLVPAGAGASVALGRYSRGAVRAAESFATLAALSMMLGLMRWPSIHWELARAHAQAGIAERHTIGAVFRGLNLYLGNYVGEFLGELCLNLFFLLTAWALIRRGGRGRWMGFSGVAVAVVGLVAMFRNITPAVAAISEVENLLLPLWMLAFGVTLVVMRHRPEVTPSA